MAMLAVWMTKAVHMNGRKVRMVLMTSGLVVNSDGRNITMHAAAQLGTHQHCAQTPWQIQACGSVLYCCTNLHTGMVSEMNPAANMTGRDRMAVTCQHAVEDAYAEAGRHQLLPQALRGFRLAHLHAQRMSINPLHCIPDGHGLLTLPDQTTAEQRSTALPGMDLCGHGLSRHHNFNRSCGAGTNNVYEVQWNTSERLEQHLAGEEALGGLGDSVAAGAEEHVGALHHMVRRRGDWPQTRGGYGHHP